MPNVIWMGACSCNYPQLMLALYGTERLIYTILLIYLASFKDTMIVESQRNLEKCAQYTTLFIFFFYDFRSGRMQMGNFVTSQKECAQLKIQIITLGKTALKYCQAFTLFHSHLTLRPVCIFNGI